MFTRELTVTRFDGLTKPQVQLLAGISAAVAGILRNSPNTQDDWRFLALGFKLDSLVITAHGQIGGV